MRTPGIWVFAAFAFLSACSAARTPIADDAKAFMQGYAENLRSGDRQAIANRYDRSGAHLTRGASVSFMSFAEITDKYVNKWTPPAMFEWSDLKYEPVSDGAVLIVGGFISAPDAEAAPASFAYTALLLRQDGELRIRAEHESGS